MPVGDTITALASPPGRSPRALIRISGPHTLHLLASHLGPSGTSVAGCRLARLHSLNLPILLTTSIAPHSYTGEDAAEILLPGNPVLVDRILQLFNEHPNVRPATPGEFTARAYLNGKLTLNQAEGVAATIAAQNDSQLAAARDLLSGATGSHYRQWAEELATLLALVEAGIDFSDQEDVVAIPTTQLRSRLATLLQAIEALAGTATEARRSLPRIVLAGAPNAGKSTLFNALLGRPRAVVSPIAGTTRDALEEPLDLSRDCPGAGPILLVDLAGLDDAPGGTIHSQMQSIAAKAIESADAVLHCDPSGRFPQLATQSPIIRVRTKADLPLRATGGRSGTPVPHTQVCALDGWNLATLRRAIADAATWHGGSAIAAVFPRHRRALAETQLHIREAIMQSGAELTAGSLRLALDSLGELTGRISPDELLGRIFSTFCIGK